MIIIHTGRGCFKTMYLHFPFDYINFVIIKHQHIIIVTTILLTKNIQG
jgi:hypothetical protein